MIWGRPTNLWLGLATAIVSGLSFVLLTAGVDAKTVASAGAALTGILGAAILLVANGNPAMQVGQQYTVVTPAGEPNVVKVANANPTPPSSLTPKTATTS